MDGLQRALQPEGLAQFVEGQIGLPVQQGAHRVLMVLHDLGLAPGQVVPQGDVPGVPALLLHARQPAAREAEHPQEHRDRTRVRLRRWHEPESAPRPAHAQPHAHAPLRSQRHRAEGVFHRH